MARERFTLTYQPTLEEVEVIQELIKLHGSRWKYLKALVSQDLNKRFPGAFAPSVWLDLDQKTSKKLVKKLNIE